MGSGVNEVQKDRQDHRKSGAAGKYPTWLATPHSSPQPQALLLVGGTAEGPHDPTVPPWPEAPGQSSCASLRREEFQEHQGIADVSMKCLLWPLGGRARLWNCLQEPFT